MSSPATTNHGANSHLLKKRGWIQKLGGGVVPRWQERLFVLRGDVLTWYDDELSLQPQNFVQITRTIRVEGPISEADEFVEAPLLGAAGDEKAAATIGDTPLSPRSERLANALRHTALRLSAKLTSSTGGEAQKFFYFVLIDTRRKTYKDERPLHRWQLRVPSVDDGRQWLYELSLAGAVVVPERFAASPAETEAAIEATDSWLATVAAEAARKVEEEVAVGEALALQMKLEKASHAIEKLLQESSGSDGSGVGVGAASARRVSRTRGLSMTLHGELSIIHKICKLIHDTAPFDEAESVFPASEVSRQQLHALLKKCIAGIRTELASVPMSHRAQVHVALKDAIHSWSKIDKKVQKGRARSSAIVGDVNHTHQHHLDDGDVESFVTASLQSFASELQSLEDEDPAVTMKLLGLTEKLDKLKQSLTHCHRILLQQDTRKEFLEKK